MKKESNLKRFFNLIIKKNKMKLVFSFMLVAIVGAIDLFLPQITKKIVDEGISRGNISLLIQLIIIYFVISSMSSIFDLILEYIYSIMKNRVSVTLKLKLLDHISKLSGRYYSNIKTGNLMSIVESDVSMIENFDASLVFSIVNNAFTAIISAFLLIKMRFDLFVIVLVLQIILTFIQNKFTKAISGKMKVMREQYGENSNLLQEYISNLMNVVFSKSKLKFFDSYIKKERSLIKKYINIDITMVGNVSVARIFSSLITVATYGYGGYLIVNKKMTLGSLIAFQQYTNMLIGPCISIIRSNNRIQQAKVSIDRVYSVIDEEIEIKTDNKAIKIGENIYNNKKQKQDKPKQDKQNQDKEKQDNKKEYSYEENNKKFKKTVETIEFKNVFFSYDKSNQCVSKEKKCISNEKKHINNIEKISENKKIINQESINENKISKDKDLENENYILNDVSLRFEKGKMTALVGESGCGKSTIINLLYRFWDVDRGEISIDGINIKDINLKSLRKNITVVTQDLLMFDDTIRNNIIVDSNKNSVSLEKICEIVDLDKFIYSLEDGLDTVIGEKGAKISGGQKQRIALARALASDNKVLILDEATSALDNISQQKILENIYQYADDKIVIVIAHRMSTIQDADMIYVFDNGKVVEEGRADELVKNGGIYKKLVSVNI